MLDEWLTKMLGYPVYEVTDAKDTNLAVRMYHEPRSLTYAKVPVADISTVNDLLGLGFRLIEVNGWFGGHGLASATAFYYDHDNVVFVEPAHHAALLNIAGSCFNWSRFHRDALTMPKANWLKREWLRNCLEGHRGMEVLVALDKKRPVGFLAIRVDGPSRVVDLLGVATQYQGKGVAGQLLRWFRILNNERTLGAGTSLANTAAVRLYQSCGFKLCSASYVLHLHRGV